MTDLPNQLKPAAGVSMPKLMRLGMSFAIIFVIGSTTVLTLAASGIGSFTIGGEVVGQRAWLRVVGPVLSLTALLMGLIAYSFYKEKPWSRHIVMLLWVAIGFYSLIGLATGILVASRASLWRALVESVVFGAIAAWYFYRKRNVVKYFRLLRQK